jgi:plasmid maintenance system antidote protein VapI
MRTTLENIEKIERLLQNEFSTAEKLAFQEELESDDNLNLLYNFQRSFIQVNQQKGLKDEISKIGLKYHRKKNNRKLLLIALLLFAAAASTFAIVKYISTKNSIKLEKTTDIKENGIDRNVENKSTDSTNNSVNFQKKVTSGNITPYLTDLNVDDIPITVSTTALEKNQISADKWSPWVKPKRQFFSFIAQNGATIEGKDGTLVIVPENAFTTENGEVVQDKIEFELIEAVKIQDMSAYNLVTVSDGKPLTSGGMIFTQAYQNGEKLLINKSKPLYIEVPTKQYNAEMLAWKGDTKNEEINWVNPKPLTQYLTKVDFCNLDFIPPAFRTQLLASLPFKGHTENSHSFEDSVYYSLLFDDVVNTIDVKDRRYSDPFLAKDFRSSNMKTVSGQEIEKTATDKTCFLNPISIKTIKSDTFQNTFLATKQFEERLQAMHKIINPNPVFSLYLANLDKNLWEVDVMAAAMLFGTEKSIFDFFANEKLTNVKDGELYAQKLSDYYNTKRMALTMEAEKTRKIYSEISTAEITKLSQQIDTLTEKWMNLERQTGQRIPLNSMNMIQTNSKRSQNTARQTNTTAATSKVYAVRWYETGWINIDAYLKDLTGETQDISINVNLENSKVFQCISALNTILPLSIINNKATAKYPNSGNIAAVKRVGKTFVLGIKRDGDSIKYAYYSFDPYTTKIVALAWKSTSEEELYALLGKILPSQNNLVAELKRDKDALNNQLKMKN